MDPVIAIGTLEFMFIRVLTHARRLALTKKRLHPIDHDVETEELKCEPEDYFSDQAFARPIRFGDNVGSARASSGSGPALPVKSSC